MHLTFLGGAGTVTGSKFLVEHLNTRILADCGQSWLQQAALMAQSRTTPIEIVSPLVV